jgi:hypothetical protein
MALSIPDHSIAESPQKGKLETEATITTPDWAGLEQRPTGSDEAYVFRVRAEARDNP